MSNHDWQAESALDPTIRRGRPISVHATEPRRVLLTGATGFLGAYVLDELLRSTAADIYCLVRDGKSASGAARLHEHIEQLGIAGGARSPRVIPIAGDLGQPLLGLSAAQSRDLAEGLDCIYHCGAQVSFALPYSALKSTNVSGAHEILRLASEGITKPVHFLSSIALFFNRASQEQVSVSELDNPVLDPARSSGYLQSKWVAEQMIASARARGLPISIYRTGRITGHSITGATNSKRDLLNTLVKGCILLKAYPSLDIEVSMGPVDYISRAVVHLSKDARSFGRNFHLYDPSPIAWRELMQIIRAEGYALSELDYDTWRAALREAAASRADADADADADARREARESLALLEMLLRAPHHLFSKRPRYEVPNSSEGLAGSGIACPRTDAALIKTYVAYFQASGFLPLPDDYGAIHSNETSRGAAPNSAKAAAGKET